MTSTYTWNATYGVWTDPANWTDLTAPGSDTAPGTADVAVIAGPTFTADSVDLIAGPASAATLSSTGQVALAGTADFGVWTQTDEALDAILPGAVVSAASATLSNVQIAGPGSALDVSGTLMSEGAISLFDQASLRVQALVSDGQFYLDPTATAEVGGGSLATAGTLAIDPSTTVTFGEAIDAPVLDDGTLVAVGYTALGNSVSGTGEIVLSGPDNSVALDASVGAGITIAFGTNSILYLPSDPSATVAATLTGFQTGDALDVNLPGVSRAVFTATGPDLGTLALLANGATVETLTLAGSYAANAFQVVTTSNDDAYSQVVLPANAAGTPAAPIANPGSDSYTWDLTGGGDWNVASNWTDITTAATATVAPGAGNSVAIGNSGRLLAILNGNGDAASLAETGLIGLNGTFDVGGGVSVGNAASFTLGTLDLLFDSTLSAGSATIGDTVVVGDDARFMVAGTIGFGANSFSGAVLAFDGGQVAAGGLSFDYGVVEADSRSAIVIGNAGSVTLGALNVAAGITIQDDFGTIDAGLVNNGLIVLAGQSYRTPGVFDGAVTGSGTIQLTDDADAQLLGSAAATQTFAFDGSEATLDLTEAGSFAAQVAGFGVTDELLVAGTVTGAHVVAATANSGVLDLTDANGDVVQTVDVNGSLAGNSFVVLADPIFDAGIGSEPPDAIVVLAAGTAQSGPLPTPSAGSESGESFAWNAPGGAWGNAENWGSLGLAPGSLDSVALDQANGSYSVITGAGNAASVSETGGDALSGSFDFGALTIQTPYPSYGWLDVAPGATLQVGNAMVGTGTLEATGAGSTLDVAGTLTLGGTGGASSTGDLFATGGASARIASLALATNPNVVDGAEIAVDATSTLEIGTAGGAAAGVLTVDAGETIGGGNGLLAIHGNVTNNGVIVGDTYGVSIDGTVGGTGTLSISRSEQLTVVGAVGAGQTIEFNGTGGSLLLTTGALPEETLGPNDAPPANPFAATVTGFAIGDALQIGSLVTDASYTKTGADLGTLALSDDGTVVATLTLTGDFAGTAFMSEASPLQRYGFGFSSVVLAAACFAEGTRLDTPDGPVAIETLRVGDLVLTASGAAPVQWIGRRRTDCRRHPRPRDVWPVRVAAHAFGPDQPRRPLFLSPDHAVFVEGVLIPVRHLLDGERIVQVQTDVVTYWHVELPRHDIVLSEGLPSESFLDTGNRAAFDNGGTVVQVHPEFARRLWDGDACAPLVVAGPVLERVRAGLQRVAARAA